ncbi:MAG: fructose-bisphosphate aldolase [Candidatus Roseilinea sp.]|nr:MAG: fructose-bisphosphate aldolase [Candidatus Roseilinea sp.]
MTVNYTKRRLHRIFNADDKTVIVAMDHGSYLDRPMAGVSDPARIIRETLAAGADAILTTFGTAMRCSDALGRGGLILSMNDDMPITDVAVERALQLGADALKVILYPFTGNRQNQTNCERLGMDCARWGLPFLVETIPGTFAAGPEMRTPEKIAAGARLGAECGADFIKTFYTGSPDSFRIVLENATVPVVVLGGERATDPHDVLAQIHDAMQAGASGVAVGRNIWGHESPAKMTAAIAAIVHGSASVDEAMRLL